MHDQFYVGQTRQQDTITNRGFPDLKARIDFRSLRFLGTDPEKPTVLINFLNPEGDLPFPACPRSTLISVLNGLEACGIKAKCGVELEWYNYHETSKSLVEKNFIGLDPITTGSFGYSVTRPFANKQFWNDLMEKSQNSGIELECFHCETGPGVLEAALNYCDALEAADRGQIFKTLVKQVGFKYGITPSFMAKPAKNLPGCGGHLHVSLWSIDGNSNLFASSGSMSITMQHFVAGVLDCISDLMPFFAPNVNSYKRLDLKYWAPVVIGWGYDSRLVAVRVIQSDHPKSSRIEFRVPGSDLNVYYAVAALLAAGHYGIQKELPLPKELDLSQVRNIESHPGLKLLPRSLKEAVDRMMTSTSKARLLFGNELVETFGMTRLHECRLFEEAITDWERSRYLEIL